MTELIITEKPSQSQKIAEALSDKAPKKKLMDKLKDVINLHGIEKINRMIQDNINSNGIGISPKYQDVV